MLLGRALAGVGGDAAMIQPGTRWPPLAIALALPLPLASLPLFALGYWDKAEPLVIWLHGVSALAALTVAISVWFGGEAVLRRVAHPFVLLPLALGGWTLLASPFVAQPLSSLMGAPQSGFGGLWFVDTAMLVAAARLAREDASSWRLLGRIAMIVSVAIVALKAWDWYSLQQGGGHLLIFVASYYGWLALALPLVVCERDRRLAWPLAIALAIASNSITAVGLLVLVLLVARIPSSLVSRFRAALLVLGAAAVPLAALQWLTLLYLKESLRDRHLVHLLVEAALAADPRGWLFGHGWGETQNAFHVWLNVAGERLWSPTWTFLSSDYFHSHNWALESLYAAGIPALLLTLAGFVALPLFAPERQRPLALAFAAAAMLFHGLWFQLCLSLPLMAMAMAALADDHSPRALPPARAVLVLLCVIAAGQVAAASALSVRGLELAAARAGLNAVPPRYALAITDFRGSDLAAAELIRDSLVSLGRRAAAGEEAKPIAEVVEAELTALDQRSAETPSPLLLTTGLSVMAAIHVTRELAFAAAPGQLEMWRRWLDRLLQVAPGRTDQAIPYFTALLSLNRLGEVAEFSTALVVRTPRDPVGLYYRGLCQAMAPDPAVREAGLSLVREAIAGGMERFLPIDPKLKAFLGVP